MALVANLFLMTVALALVAYPLLRSEKKKAAPRPDAQGVLRKDALTAAQQAAIAEVELDKAMGKVTENDYKEIKERLSTD